MKFGLILSLFLVSSFASAQTLREQKIKKEMLTRVEKIIKIMEDTRDDLDRQDVDNACSKVKELFAIYPDHVKGILSHMNLFSKRVIDAKDESLSQLIFIHKQTLICGQGTGCEYVDPKLLSKQLKVIVKSLKKQRKTILKGDTDFENTFHYEYEFN
jgi:hypothetical protein